MTPFSFVEFAEALPREIAQWKRELAGAALATSMDPVLLSAIMAQESGGKSPTVLGFDRHGHGLMQVDDRSHKTFCLALWGRGPIKLIHRPTFNILYAAELLAENMRAFQGDLWAAVASYNAGPAEVRKALAKAGPAATHLERFAAVNAETYKKEYCVRVRHYFETFSAAFAAAQRKRGVV